MSILALQTNMAAKFLQNQKLARAPLPNASLESAVIANPVKPSVTAPRYKLAKATVLVGPHLSLAPRTGSAKAESAGTALAYQAPKDAITTRSKSANPIAQVGVLVKVAQLNKSVNKTNVSAAHAPQAKSAVTATVWKFVRQIVLAGNLHKPVKALKRVAMALVNLVSVKRVKSDAMVISYKNANPIAKRGKHYKPALEFAPKTNAAPAKLEKKGATTTRKKPAKQIALAGQQKHAQAVKRALQAVPNAPHAHAKLENIAVATETCKCVTARPVNGKPSKPAAWDVATTIALFVSAAPMNQNAEAVQISKPASWTVEPEKGPNATIMDRGSVKMVLAKNVYANQAENNAMVRM